MPIGPNQPTNTLSLIVRISGIHLAKASTAGIRLNASMPMENPIKRLMLTGGSGLSHTDQGRTVPRVVNTETSRMASIPSEKWEWRSSSCSSPSQSIAIPQKKQAISSFHPISSN